MNKIKTPNGNFLTRQDEIVCEIQRFYSHLFRNTDAELENIDLQKTLPQKQPYQEKNENMGTEIKT